MPLVNGDAAYPEMLQAIDSAEALDRFRDLHIQIR